MYTASYCVWLYCIHESTYIVISTCNSCNIGTRDLPDMYAKSPRAEGIHIRQITSAAIALFL